MRPLRLLALTLAAVSASVAVADAKTYDIRQVLSDDIQRLAPKADVPIRLPGRMPLDYDRSLYGDGTAKARAYTFFVDATEDCAGATVCYLGQFGAERGATPSFRRTVTLANGITGHYKPITCGASCSPPMIEWVQAGVLYSIQAKLGVSGRARQRRAMVRAANSAIRSAPR